MNTSQRILVVILQVGGPLVIVCIQHPCTNGLSKPASTTDTGKLALSIKGRIDNLYQSAFVYIFAVPYSAEANIAYFKKTSQSYNSNNNKAHYSIA